MACHCGDPECGGPSLAQIDAIGRQIAEMMARDEMTEPHDTTIPPEPQADDDDILIISKGQLRAAMREAIADVVGPVTEGEPAHPPTSRWTVEHNTVLNEAEDAEIQVYRTCGDSSALAVEVAAALNGERPEPTAEQVYDWIAATAGLVPLEDIRCVLDARAALIREDNPDGR